jgi:hypothetical protein
MLETARIFFGQLMSAMRPNGMPLLLKITLTKDIGRSSQNLSLSAQIFDLMELGESRWQDQIFFAKSFSPGLSGGGGED